MYLFLFIVFLTIQHGYVMLDVPNIKLLEAKHQIYINEWYCVSMPKEDQN
jgi:hypothetical protein